MSRELMSVRRRGKLSSQVRSRSLGEVALHSQLEAAQQRIFNLEDVIRDREKQFQVNCLAIVLDNKQCH